MECVPREGKVTACVGCQQARQRCEKPGEEGMEKKVVQRRKRAEEVVVVEVPKGSQRKKVRTESEPEGSRGRTEEQEEQTLQQELHNFGKRFLVQWDQQNRHMEQQNKLLGQLVELKSKEIWSMGLEENDEDIDAEMERKELEREELERLTAEECIVEVRGVATVVAGLMVEAEKAKRMEGLEEVLESESESESSEDLEGKPAVTICLLTSGIFLFSRRVRLRPPSHRHLNIHTHVLLSPSLTSRMTKRTLFPLIFVAVHGLQALVFIL